MLLFYGPAGERFRGHDFRDYLIPADWEVVELDESGDATARRRIHERFKTWEVLPSWHEGNLVSMQSPHLPFGMPLILI